MLLLDVVMQAGDIVQQAPPQGAALAKQVAPNIYVTVQQAAGGLPEWAKILISAATGAVLGISSNIAMEFIKPAIAKSRELKKLNGQLIPELEQNLNKVETLNRMIKRANESGVIHRKMTLSYGRDILAGVSSDRYTYNFEREKALVYEVDPQTSLSTFYASIAIARDFGQKLDYGMMINFVRSACETGRKYLSQHGLEYTSEPDPFYDQLIPEPTDADNPENWHHELTSSGAFESAGQQNRPGQY